MGTDKRNILFIKRNNCKRAKIVHNRIFGESVTSDNDGASRFCLEIFRYRCITNSHTARIPPLQKF